MPSKPPTPSELIDARIDEYPDWRGTTLARIRELIQQALPDVVEEWKWRACRLVPGRHALHRRGLQERREGDLRQGRVARTRRASSTPASTATCGARSTSRRATRSTPGTSRPSSAAAD